MSIALLESRGQIPPGYYTAQCAVSGGTLEAYLRRAMDASEKKLCIRLGFVTADFLLPCPDGTGHHISRSHLQNLTETHPVHFSEKLGTNYLTYPEDNHLHVVLFDTDDTLRYKLQLCDRLGIPFALAEDCRTLQILKK